MSLTFSPLSQRQYSTCLLYYFSSHSLAHYLFHPHHISLKHAAMTPVRNHTPHIFFPLHPFKYLHSLIPSSILNRRTLFHSLSFLTYLKYSNSPPSVSSLPLYHILSILLALFPHSSFRLTPRPFVYHFPKSCVCYYSSLPLLNFYSKFHALFIFLISIFPLPSSSLHIYPG